MPNMSADNALAHLREAQGVLNYTVDVIVPLLAELEELREKVNLVCRWTFTAEGWLIGCGGVTFQTPTFRHCPNCGGRIEEVK